MESWALIRLHAKTGLKHLNGSIVGKKIRERRSVNCQRPSHQSLEDNTRAVAVESPLMLTSHAWRFRLLIDQSVAEMTKRVVDLTCNVYPVLEFGSENLRRARALHNVAKFKSLGSLRKCPSHTVFHAVPSHSKTLHWNHLGSFLLWGIKRS